MRFKVKQKIEDLLRVQCTHIVEDGEEVYEQFLLKKYSDVRAKMEYFLVAQDLNNPSVIWGIIKKDKLIFSLISQDQIRFALEDKGFIPCKCSKTFNVFEIKIV